MKKRTSRHQPRSYSEQQLSGLHISTTTRKQETVERLKTAIESLKAKGQAITAQNIYAECGLHYSTYVRNDEAIALFRTNSTHLTQKKKRTKRKTGVPEDTPSLPSPRDPLLNHKKPQLVMRLREVQQQIQDQQQQLAVLADGCLQRDAHMVE